MTNADEADRQRQALIESYRRQHPDLPHGGETERRVVEAAMHAIETGAVHEYTENRHERRARAARERRRSN